MSRLVWHLAWHDLRATRLLASLWLAAVALEIAFVVLGPIESFGARADDTLSLVFEFTRWLGPALLTTLVVQRDPLSDPAAFWRTRPIPRVVLWLSKMASVVVLVAVVPAAVLALGLSSVGVPGLTALRHARDLAIDHATIACAAALVAVPTRSLAHAVSAAVGGLIGLFVGGALLDALRPTGMMMWPQLSSEVWLAAGLAGGTAITALHYLTQRHRLARGLTVLLAAFGVIGPAFGVTTVSPLADQVLPLAADAGTVTLGPEAEWGVVSTSERVDARFSTRIQASSSSPDTFFTPTGATVTLHLASGPALVREAVIESPWAEQALATPADPPFANLRALLGVASLTLPAGMRASTRPRMVLPVSPATRDEMQATGVRLTADVTLLEQGLDAAARVAARPGAMTPTRNGRLRVSGWSARPGELVVDLHWVGYSAPGGMPVLVAADGRRAILGRVDESERQAFVRPARRTVNLAGVRLALGSARERLTFPMPSASAAVGDAAWRDATLVLIESGQRTRSRRVRIDIDGVGRAR